MDAAEVDVAIAGAGPSGLALAIALARGGRRVLACDARTAQAVTADARALALSHGSRVLLESLDAWSGLDATPIETIHVSQHGGFGRTLIRARELDVPALGYVVPAGALAARLRETAEAAGVGLRHRCEVGAAEAGTQHIRVALHAPDDDRHDTCTARLLVRAEGAPDEAAGIVTRDYDQHALISLATPCEGHGNVAFERFTPHGPLALLPCGRDFSVVHVVAAQDAERLLALPDDAYLHTIQTLIGQRVRLAAIGPRARWPLALRVRRDTVAARTVWLGNAAQTLHPVAGQGFNLALRDVVTLARALHDAPDAGAAAALAAWARGRRIDRAGTAGFTDGLIRVFANDFAPLRALRGAGLLALDLCPPARAFVARRMMFGARAWP